MATTKNLIYLIVIILIIAGVAGWFIYRDSDFDLSKFFNRNQNQEQNQDQNQNEQRVLSPEELKAIMPDLDKEIVFYDDIFGEAQKQNIINQINAAKDALKKDYDRREDWLQLGLLYKTIEDFQSAKEAWEFLTLARPDDSVAYHNLGDLYWMHLNDFFKAEEFFKKAIERDPQPSYFQKLHELYRYSLKEKSDWADDVLLDGIKARSSDPYLMYVLGQYYEDTGNITGAIEYYQKALNLDSGNTKMKQYLEELKAGI